MVNKAVDHLGIRWLQEQRPVCTSPAEGPLWLHSFLLRLAKSCQSTCRVSSLCFQLALRDLYSQSTLHTTACPDISKKSTLDDTSTFSVTEQRIAATRETDEGERPWQCCGWSFIYSCLQNGASVQWRQCLIVFFPFLYRLDILLFSPFNLKSKTCQIYHWLLFPCPFNCLSLFPAPGPQGVVRNPGSSSDSCLLHVSLFGTHPLSSGHEALITWLLSFTLQFYSQQPLSQNSLLCLILPNTSMQCLTYICI